MISNERKEELIAAIKQQEENWAYMHHEFPISRMTASRELAFSEPLPFCLDGKTYNVEKVTLKVTSGGRATSRVRFYPREDVWPLPAGTVRDPDLNPEEESWAYLVDVVRDSEITEEADIAIGMALSFMGNELSRKLMDKLKSSPTLLSLLSRFSGEFGGEDILQSQSSTGREDTP